MAGKKRSRGESSPKTKAKAAAADEDMPTAEDEDLKKMYLTALSNTRRMFVNNRTLKPSADTRRFVDSMSSAHHRSTTEPAFLPAARR